MLHTLSTKISSNKHRQCRWSLQDQDDMPACLNIQYVLVIVCQDHVVTVCFHYLGIVM